LNPRCMKPFCNFAHGPERHASATELNPHYDYNVLNCDPDTLMQAYKTEPCASKLRSRGGPQCPCRDFKYHSPDERRRVPGGYSSVPCSRACVHGLWKATVPCSEACPFAHTRFEVMFHPLLYKTQPCERLACPFGLLCAHAHGVAELRRPRRRGTSVLPCAGRSQRRPIRNEPVRNGDGWNPGPCTRVKCPRRLPNFSGGSDPCNST
jgi:hypothetical protein